MKHIIVGTDRPGSKSRVIAEIMQGLYRQNGEEVELLDLREIARGFADGPQYGDVKNPILVEAASKIEKSDGLIIVVPEYNGSMPGALKYFIDHLKYPEAFEARPVAFIGLGGMFGGLRPVEHLQGVFGYRNAFIYPERVFILNVWNHFKKTEANPNGEFKDPLLLQLMDKQVRGFQAFVNGLKQVGLHTSNRTLK
ncbi:MAG TPA: NADPH-dependent FMN reductase [Pseudobdellovibrionaceae bacterium]|nr:NADPH-dependent FMN reductase [Pseudobdellovibrionaceae bacterium]